MNHPLLSKGFSLIFITLLAFFLLACGGGGSGGENNNPVNGDNQDPGDGSQWVLSESVCEGLAPVAAHGLPTDAVALGGWPESNPAALIVAQVRSSVSDNDWTVTMVRDFPDLPTSVIVPLHPSASPEGGAVTLTFGQIDASGEEFWCQQEHDFLIEPLPPVDTTVDAAATLRALRDLGETIAARYSQTLSSVRGMSPEDLPEHLYPLYFSAHLLGNADDALQGQLDELPPDHRELLDRLLTHINFKQYLDTSDAELRSASFGFFNAQDFAQNGAMARALGSQGCDFPSVESLSRLMSASGWSADVLTGKSGAAMDALAATAGVIGLIPHPAAQGASRAGGALLFTVKTMLEGISNLFPSRFTEADFTYTDAFFEEDSDGIGTWMHFRARTTSKGWKLDQTILKGLLVGAGTAGPQWSKWMDHVVGRWEGLAREFAQSLTNKVILKGTQAMVDHFPGMNQSSLVEIAPKCWYSDGFGGNGSNTEWTEVEFRDSIQEAASRPHFGYQPRQVGAGSLVVRPDPARFGGATFDVSKPVDVGSIQISFSPPLNMVEPGQTVELTVTVHNAIDRSIRISDGLNLVLEPDMGGSDSYSFSYTVPNDRDALPIRITATSLSEGGLRDLPDAPERSGSAVLQDEDIILFVSPGYACLEPGESKNFTTATFLGVDTGPVEWSATGGSISSSGRFTAGNTGSATITATLRDRPNIRATGRIDIMNDCDACRWRASVGGVTFGGAKINITPHSGLAGHLISLMGPETNFEDATFSNILLNQALEPGSPGTPSLYHVSVAPGPISAWGAPFELLGEQGVIIDIPKPNWEIIRNQAFQDKYGQEQALIEGKLSGTMISVELGYSGSGLPKMVQGSATIDFVGTFYINEIGGNTYMSCNASN